MPNGLCFADATFFILTVPHGDQLSQNILHWSSPNVHNRYVCGWAWSF